MSTHTDHARTLDTVQSHLRGRDFAGALAAARDWLEADPDAADAAYFVAVAQRAMGQIDEAAATLEALLQQHPSHSRGLQEYGHLLRDRQQPAAALGFYRRATRENPALLASWQAQVKLSQQLGDSVGAQQADAQWRWLSSLPEPLRIVIDLVARDRLIPAENLCKRFLQANPRHTEGMRLLADIAVRLGAFAEATLLLDSACELAPRDKRLRVDRVNLLRRSQRFAEARAAAEALAEEAPDNPQFQSMAAVEAMHLGDYPMALARFDRVLERLPEDPVTLTSRGHALKTCGQTDAAIASYRRAIEALPHHGEAWYALANLKTYRFDSDDITRMSQLAEDPVTAADARVYLHFALGKAHEDAEAWGVSFHHYAAGNRLKRQRSSYSAGQLSEELALQKTHCDAALFAPERGEGHPAPDPIFIVGLPRAGSTLLEQILASHSQIDGTLELPNILTLAQSLRRREGGAGYPENLWSLSVDERRALGEQFIADTRIHRGAAPLFIDKMPNNFRHVGLIKLILPNARIIDARRHPMACCFSGFKQLFAEGQEFSYDLDDLGRYYRDYVDLMAHWQAVLPGSILQVNNEDVIADLEGQVRRLLDFLELPFEENCLRYWQTDRAIKTPSSEQVRQPVSDRGQHQWRHYRPWLQPLADGLGPALTALSE